MTLAVACSSTGAGSAAGGAHHGVLTSLTTPQQALRAAASQEQRFTSGTETISIRESGATDLAVSGTIVLRLKPSLGASEDLRMTMSGQATRLKMIMTGTALYLDESAISAQLGKPWAEIKLASLKGSPLAGLVQLIQDAQTNTYGNQAQLFAVAKNAHVVGTQTLDHVRTTEYAGSFRIAAALAALPAATRKLLAPDTKELGNSVVTFREWIDTQHHVRKMTEVETGNGRTTSTTMNVSSINQPVRITVPPASQTIVESKI